MLKISYATCPCLLISAQFALEMRLVGENRKKSIKAPILAYKVKEFGGNREPVYEFLLVMNSNLGPVSHRYWDTATYCLKVANFSHSFSFNAYAGGDPLRIYKKSFADPETRVFQAADIKDLVILACTVFDWSTSVTDGQTDTYKIAMANRRWKQ